MTIVVSIFFILSLGFSILNIKRVINIDREFRALMYNSDVVQFFLSSSMIFFATLSIFILFFYSWKLFIALVLINLIIQNNIIVPLVEKILEMVTNKIVGRINIKKIK
jgi:hypothetical protein